MIIKLQENKDIIGVYDLNTIGEKSTLKIKFKWCPRSKHYKTGPRLEFMQYR